jgi:alkanesulfonate monooxygenase SsuD/methylene tetrahydromethanopterin reductase-like flavin-dependent oxidoreductase (luciferase family)
LQDNGIPLWIAGGGEKVTLRIAAQYAQYTNFTPEPEAFARKSEMLAQHCRDLGTDFDAIVRSANFTTVVGASEADVKDRQQRVRDRMVGYVPEAVADAMIAGGSGPDSATGTPEQVIERIARVRDLGCEYAICYFPEAAYDRSGVELFEREVIPALS